MPLLTSSAAALPYVDVQPSVEAMSTADSLIRAELDSDSATDQHPAIPAMREPQFSELVQAEHDRLAAGTSRAAGIDMSRYEALDAPGAGQPAEWKETLQRAYVSAGYMRSREVNLSLLETYGRNAWLIGNSQLEDTLRALEKEVEASRLEQEALEAARRAAQDSAVGEMQGLEETWKKGLGRMIETQAAAEGLRQEILSRKRAAAS